MQRRLAWGGWVLVGWIGGLLLGCSGSGNTSAPAPGPGQLSVSLVDAPAPDVKALNLHIARVEIQGPDGWVVLSSPDKVIDLLKLTGGVVETLAPAKALTEGTYTQLRLVLGAQNTVVYQDGSSKPLVVPSGSQTGVKLTGSFKVAPGTTRDLFIDFDAAHSLQVHTTGNGKVMLRPVVRVVDRLATGSLSGSLRDGTGPLAGALVMAQVQDAGGPRLVRTVKTAADGTFSLDLLPLDATYAVVCLPVVNGASAIQRCGLAVLDGQALSAATPVRTGLALTASPATALGDLTVTCTPVPDADTAEQVDLLQAVSTVTWIAQTKAGVVGTTSSTASFLQVPAGSYGVRVLRTTQAADGTTSQAVKAGGPVTVPAGGSATWTVAF